MNFTDFGFDERLEEGIAFSGYKQATPVQQQVIPHVLEGRDVIASAQTGTGKTAAFLLPLIHKIITQPNHDHINALILVPTRELAIQIAQNLEGLSYFTPVSSLAVYGGGDGMSFVQEKQALSKGADIIISTPGRLISHLGMGYVKMQQLEYLVLDEADRMLDMGFFEDILKIISYLPEQRQNLCFSATMPPKMRELARRILRNPAEINISISKPPDTIKQEAYVVHEPQKHPLLLHLIREAKGLMILIFCSKKQNVKQLARDLNKARLNVGEIHSDLEQSEREQVLSDFINHRKNILIATDILSRGIHIDNIDLVINYDVPVDGEDYVHRIGRTARAATKGTAITLISGMEQNKFSRIEKLIQKTVEKMPLPPELGEAPVYAPQAGGGGGKRRNNRPNRNGNGKHRKPSSGNNKPAPPQA